MVKTYVHDEDAGFVELLYCPLRRHADGADEELGLLLDDDVDELGELTFGVIVLYMYTLAVNTRYALNIFMDLRSSYVRYHRPEAATGQHQTVHSCP